MKRLLILFLIPCSLWAQNAHPRIWLSSAVKTELAAKIAASDADYATIKTDADTLKTYPPQALTVSTMSNSNPVTVTVNEVISTKGWCGGNGSAVSMYVAGLTGSWTALNATNTRVATGAGTKTGTSTFTLPFDSTGWGAYPGGAVLFFNNATCGNMLYYDYEGLGWLSWFEELGLMYQLTGDSSYATNALLLLDYINTLAPQSLIAPFAIDSGYPARGAVLGVALAYDWFYPLLSSGEKTATVATLNAWYTFYQNNISNSSIIFLGESVPTSNYWGGFMLGFGAAGMATLGDNSNAATINTFIRGQVDTYIAQAISSPGTGWYSDQADVCPYNGGSATCGGGFAGGYPDEGYNYGPNHLMRLLQYFNLVKTATNEDMYSTTAYAATLADAVATNIVYSLFPNMWQAPNTGESADVIPIYLDLPVVLAYMRQGQNSSAWMQYYAQNQGTLPGGGGAIVAYQGFQGALSSNLPMNHFIWYRTAITATNWSGQNPYKFSNGDGQIHWRSDWTTSAMQITFAANPEFLAGHHIRNAGGVTVTRGGDYGIINAGHFNGTTGYSGAGGSPSTIISDDSPVLHFNDSNVYMYGYQTQQNWGQWITPLYKLTSNYAYGQNDFTGAYDDKVGSGRNAATRTLQYDFRSVAQMGNCTFVYDRVGALSSAYAKTLYWYFSPITTAVPTLASNIASAVVGSSKFFVDPLLPASPSTALTQVTSGAAYRVEISDSATNTATAFLSLIYSNSSGSSLPASTVLTSSGNMVAAQVSDTTPIVFAHSNVVTNNGNNTYTLTTQTTATFTSTHTGTGNYLIGGLAVGTYTVTGPCSTGCSGNVVGADGTLFFTGTSGSYSLAQTSAPATSYSPTSLTFSNQNVGTSSSGQAVTLTNVGTATLTITSIAMQTGTQFSNSTTCGGTLAASSNCTITVTFTPTSAGAKTDNIVVTTNAGSSPDSVPVSGTGVAAGPVFSQLGNGVILSNGATIQ